MRAGGRGLLELHVLEPVVPHKPAQGRREQVGFRQHLAGLGRVARRGVRASSSKSSRPRSSDKLYLESVAAKRSLGLER